jgi:hypothetical protein
MKRIIALVCTCAVAAVLLTGCSGITSITGGAGGSLFTQVNNGVAVGTAAGMSKVGMAKSTAIIGIATGDSSISAAMKAGGITKIHHIDCKVTSVLGIYAEYTTVVYGE